MLSSDEAMANAVDNAPPPDVVSVAKSVVAAGVAPTTANAAVPDVFTVAKNEFPDVAAAIKPVTTANVMSMADNVATVSPEDNATAPKTLAAATVAPPAGVVDLADAFPTTGAGWSPAGTANFRRLIYDSCD